MTVFQKLGLSLNISTVLTLSSVGKAAVDPKSSTQQSPNTVDANLVLVFSTHVDLKASVVEIRDRQNHRIKTLNLRLAANGLDVEIPLSMPLPPGRYTITWRAVSIEGRVSVGGYAFSVDPIIDHIPAVAQQSPFD